VVIKMAGMNDKQFGYWPKTREMGRGRYTLIYGVLMWGIATGIGWAIVMAAMQGWDRLPFLLVGALILFPIGGIFWGRYMWRMMEARYQKELEARSLRPDDTEHDKGSSPA
jgi:hypothetical protein